MAMIRHSNKNEKSNLILPKCKESILNSMSKRIRVEERLLMGILNKIPKINEKVLIFENREQF